MRQVEAFVKVVDTGSLTRAAKALRRSLPAISRQIDALEADLGRALFVRTTRRVVPTDAGRAFEPHARRLLFEAERARESVAGGRTLSGTVVVSASITLGMARVVPYLPLFAEAQPRIVVELRLEDRAVDFLADGVDVALRAGLPLPDSADVVAHRLATFPLWLVASAEWVARHGAPKRVEALARLPAIHGSSQGETHTLTLRRGDEETRVELRAAFRATAPLARFEAARRGLGFASVPSFLAAEAVERGEMVRLLPEHSLRDIGVFALHRVEARDVGRVRAFVAHLGATVPSLETAFASPPQPRAAKKSRTIRSESRTQVKR